MLSPWPNAHLLRRDCRVSVAVEGHEVCVPRDLGQVVFVGVIKVESPAKGAAGR